MLLIKGGTIIRAEDTLDADILVDGDKISRLITEPDESLDQQVDTVMDASGN